MQKSTFISIVTVVFNGEKELEKTIQSVINQTYKNFEYIIIDGGSNDGTLEIIKKYENHIDHWITEKDHGTYDAMNKSLDFVRGEWVNFMNSGDTFVHKHVLNNIVNVLKEGSDIIFGDVIVQYDDNNRKHVKPNMLSHFYKGLPFCHQSSFISTKLLRQEKYNLNYTLCADFHFFYKAYTNGKKFTYTDQVIALYDYNGISSNLHLTFHEKREIVLSYHKKYGYYYGYLYFKNLLTTSIKKLLPLKMIRKVQMAKNGKKW